MLQEPFTIHEWKMFSAFLADGSLEAKLLKCQLESFCPDSELYLKPWTILFCKITLARIRRRKLSLKLSNDFAKEDWALGDRRKYLLDDIVVKATDGVYYQLGLTISEGYLAELTLLSQVLDLSQPFVEPTTSLSEIKSESFWMKTETGWEDAASFSLRKKLGVPEAIERSQPYFECFSLLDQKQYQLSGARLPFTCRRAKPATDQEIEEFESRHQCKLPQDLLDFWKASNGMSLFLMNVCGTYDSKVVYPRSGESGKWIQIANNILGIEGDMFTVDVEVVEPSERRPPSTRIIYNDNFREWSRLEDFLLNYVNELVPNTLISN